MLIHPEPPPKEIRSQLDIIYKRKIYIHSEAVDISCVLLILKSIIFIGVDESTTATQSNPSIWYRAVAPVRNRII